MAQPGNAAQQEHPDDTIDVLVVEPTGPAETITDQSLGLRWPHLADAVSPRSFAPDVLGRVVAEVSRQVDAVMAHVDDTQQRVLLDEVTVAVALTATGGVQWVMNLSSSVQGTLSLTFKVKHSPAAKTLPITS